MSDVFGFDETVDAAPQQGEAQEADFFGGGEEDAFGNNDFGEGGLDGEYDTLQDSHEMLGDQGEPMGEAVESMPAPVPDTQQHVVAEDDAPLKAFEKQWHAELQEKDSKDSALKESMKEEAKKELEQFYETKQTNRSKKAASNREQEQDLMNAINDALTAENPWERISTLIDTNGKNDTNERDTSRLRSILIQLKNSPLTASQA